MKTSNGLKRHWPAVAGIAVGALGGFLYWWFVGCTSGTCPITSSPWMSTLWGALMGYLVSQMFVGNKAGKPENEE